MSDFSIESQPTSGSAWYKSEKAKIVGGAAAGTGLALGAVWLADRMTDDHLGKSSGKWAGKEVGVERKLFRAFRDARLARQEANKWFKVARKAKGPKDQHKAYQKALRHWNDYLAAMEELDELLGKFEAKSSAIAKSGDVAPYSKGGRASKKGKVPVTHPAHRAPKGKAKSKAASEAKDLAEAKAYIAEERKKFDSILADAQSIVRDLTERQEAEEITVIAVPVGG